MPGQPLNLILVGRVAGAFGVRGELRLSAYTEEPLALLEYRDLKRADGAPALTLEHARVARPGELVGRAREVGDRDAAEAMRGLDLYIPRDILPTPTDDDEFYLADLIGLAAATPAGTPLGMVKAVYNYGAGDILEIDPGDGRPTRLYPFTRAVVPEVRLRDARLVIVPPSEVAASEDGDDA